jgi:hypothetical protein
MPVIEKVPLIGDEKNPPPRLEWKKPSLTKDGRGYICAEVTFDSQWRVFSAEIIQCARFDAVLPDAPDSRTATGNPILPGRKARCPLAMLVQRKTGMELFQIQFGDITVAPQPRISSADVGRVFFS